MPIYRLPYPTAPLVPSHLLEAVQQAKARAVLRAAQAANSPATRLAEVYDTNAELSPALAALIPGFEYPDHSHKTLSALLKSTQSAAVAHSFCWRYADKSKWYSKSFEEACPLKAVERLQAHLARVGKDRPVVVDHLAYSSTAAGAGLFEANGYSLLALETPRPFSLVYADVVVAPDAALMPENA